MRRRNPHYSWVPPVVDPNISFKTLEPESGSRAKSRDLRMRLAKALSEFRPESVFIPGWSEWYSLAALSWCAGHRVPAVLMSESTWSDSRRYPFKEWVKTGIVSLCSAALAGGARQSQYLRRLGVPAENIFLGYDVVDNACFRQHAQSVRAAAADFRARYKLPARYFLACARFLKRKNLSFLISEYALYRDAMAACGGSEAPCSLVILGDGPARQKLETQVQGLNLSNYVLLPGLIEYPDLPAYYGLASGFVHASISEPWGLVVNEAMASGLPVLVSDKCGCADDLVREGVNGFTFDPSRPGELSILMVRLSAQEQRRIKLGQASQALMAAWGPDRFSQGLIGAARRALEIGPKRAGWWSRCLLGILQRR